MTVKRRNHGRNRPPKSRGKSKNVRCDSTGKVVSKDKAIKRFVVRNMVDSSSLRDIRESCAIEGYVIPKFYCKMYYSVDAAVHRRIVRGRAKTVRKNRDPPPRRRRPVEKKKEDEALDERTDAQKTADAHKVKANELYKKRSFEEALAEYQKAIDAEPNDATYYTNMAACLMEKGDYEKCLATCQAVLDKRYEMNGELPGGASFEKIAKVYNRMGSCYQRQKQFDTAIEYYGKALTEDNNKNTRNALRECERAKEKFEADSYLDPAKAEECREKGNELFKAQKYAEAKTYYDDGIKRNPKDAKLYSNRAACLNKLGAAPDALKDLDKCLELDPKFVRAYARKGQTHFLMKENHKALKAYEDGLKIDPDNQELIQGRQQVMYAVQSGQNQGTDQEQVAHAMADPEIQDILKDPQINIVLQNMQDNPARINEYMQDPKIASAMNKLIAAGVLKVGSAPPGR